MALLLRKLNTNETRTTTADSCRFLPCAPARNVKIKKLFKPCLASKYTYKVTSHARNALTRDGGPESLTRKLFYQYFEQLKRKPKWPSSIIVPFSVDICKSIGNRALLWLIESLFPSSRAFERGEDELCTTTLKL